MNNRVLVTGGLGNIGSYVASSRPSTHKVIALDSARGRGSVETALRNVGVELMSADLRSFTGNPYDFGINSVIHCAALVSPQVSGAEARTYNFELTEAAVDLANRLKARLIFVSTTSVYERTSSPSTCANVVTGGATEYSMGKLEEENFVRNQAKKYSVIRLGSAFGTSLQINKRTAINRIVLSAAETGEFRSWRLGYDAISSHASVDGIAKAIWHVVSADFMSGMTLDYAPIAVTLREVHEAATSFLPQLALTFEEHPNDSPDHLRIEMPPFFSKIDTSSELRSKIGELIATVQFHGSS